MFPYTIFIPNGTQPAYSIEGYLADQGYRWQMQNILQEMETVQK